MIDVVIAIVVTYNRKLLLKRCLFSLLAQSHPPASIIIIDNASTDGTKTYLNRELMNNPSVTYLNLGRNLGGAGGFHYGAMLAIERNADWVWMMDDDCVLEKDCLKKLMNGIRDKRDIYSPIILSAEDKSTVLWGINAEMNTGNVEVITLPFNGFLIHRESIEEIGFPDERFFIYGDDTEYNLRAKLSGRKIMMVTDSIMYHPHKNMLKGLNILNMYMSKIWVYYKLRNAVIIYKKYNYYSVNQVLMFISSLFLYILTLRFNLIGLWIEGLRDGLKDRLYVRDMGS